MKRLVLFSVLFGILVLVLVGYFIHDSGRAILMPKMNDSCLHGNRTGICKSNSSCLTNLSNDKLEPCNEGDFSLLCCPKRIPGEKAKEKCKFYARKKWNFHCRSRLWSYHMDGGLRAKRNEFPHMTLLGNYVPTGSGVIYWLCGGSIVSPRFILSAAHCNISKKSGYAMFGAYSLENTQEFIEKNLLKIIDVIIHPDYKPGSNNNDIALLKLSDKLNTEVPICLDTGSSIPIDMEVIATGFGVNKEQVANSFLQKVSLNIVDQASCIEKYEEIQANTSKQIKIVPENHVCAYANGKDTCSGDSGGPLQISHSKLPRMYTLIGVTSFGVNCTLDANLPGVYTKVSSYVGWIEDIVWPA